MRAQDSYSTLFWLAFSIYVAKTASIMGLGTLEKPGPGYFPFGGAAILGISALVVLGKSLSQNRRGRTTAVDSERLRWQNVVWVLAAATAFGLFLEKIGFTLCTFFLFLFFLRVVARQRWVRTVVVALCVTLGSYLVFNVGLNAQLPGGLLGF